MLFSRMIYLIESLKSNGYFLYVSGQDLSVKVAELLFESSKSKFISRANPCCHK